jgi:hypothetical protein
VRAMVRVLLFVGGKFVSVMLCKTKLSIGHLANVLGLGENDAH